ncbi:ammonium transporter [Bacillus methanolicus PB1]|uniref:Ammonium transporter n=1 Tax=Bacillus methanolicus PB1 TaxID=997296 RepID=I3E6B6_BACMT|nr:ammonium transporter [Bacillus methanolicus]EIJ82037.1 ammonium transporter [Bacillus methanolicus PB1]
MRHLFKRRVPLLLMSTLCFSLFSPLAAFAQENTVKVDTGDATWILAATAIVLFMHVPGLALFYGGLVSQKNVVSTMMHSFTSLLVVSVVWVLWGYSLTYGTDIGGIIGGFDYIGFKDVGAEATFGTLTIPHYIYAIFQTTFAAITVAIVSGGITGRIAFPAWIIFSILWSSLIYAPMAHWVWGGGWLSNLGELDFAGGTVVHVLAGVSALVAALIIGPRHDKHENAPHNLVLFLIGAATLWFGWLAFNGGSALASGGLASLAFANTHVAACAAGISWLAIEWIIRKRPTLVGAATGAIAGLVAITPAAGYVTVPSSLIIGFTGSLVCYFGVNFVKVRFKYDDTLDAFGVHGIGGIWGALATGIFASKEVNPAGNNGLLYGNPEQLLPQMMGVGVTVVLAVVGTLVILKVISLFTPLRVSKEDELIGLDLSFHEEPAYMTTYQSLNTNSTIIHPAKSVGSLSERPLES